MTPVIFRFYADLNKFLPQSRRQKSFAYPAYGGTQTVKHLIEASGVPHTEVELILANSNPVDFSYLVQPSDLISVYPAFRSPKIIAPIELRPPIPEPALFLLDNHLGRLARYLRLLGFDTLYFNNRYDDAQLAQMAHEEERILLSRDRGLLMRSLVVHGYCLRTTDSKEQVRATIHRYQLYEQIKPWRRCLRCNGHLLPVGKDRILDRLEPKTKQYYHEFQICRECEQIYWKGSHFGRLERFVAEITGTDTQQQL
jgi:uncharacterized protein with PIN domain